MDSENFIGSKEWKSLFAESILEEIGEEIIVVDEYGTIQEANRAFLQEYGKTKEEVLGKNCREVRMGSGAACRIGTEECPLENAMATGRKAEITDRYKTEDGTFREVSRILFPLAAGEKKLRYFIEISRDRTEYGDLIRKLKTSEKRFKAILDTATDAVISINSDHNIVLFNDAAQKIFGYTRDDVLGKNLNLLIPSQYGHHYLFVRNFLESGASKIMGKWIRLTGLKSNGEEIPIELGLSHMKIDGENTFTAMVRDISEQQQLEKKLLRAERFAAVGQIVSHVAHEIKNPLMIIGGFTQQIKESVSNEKALMKLEMITAEVSRLEKLVASLGDFTKVYNLAKRSADMNSVISDVLKIVGGAYSEEFRFETGLFPELGEIQCDPDKIRQVLLNIIANGIDAMEDGGTISISTVNAEDGIEIRIRDEGIGIREEEIIHIFEPFYTTREKGSGLGLAICYKIIEAHNGDIWADSIPGKGTTFVIRLPSG